MAKPPVANPRPGYPASPCIRHCVLDDNRLCTGCKRHIDEIVAWARMSAAEQWSVINDLQNRETNARVGDGDGNAL